MTEHDPQESVVSQDDPASDLTAQNALYQESTGREENPGQLESSSAVQKLVDRLDKVPVQEQAPIYEELLAQLRRELDKDPTTVPSGLSAQRQDEPSPQKEDAASGGSDREEQTDET